MNKELKPVRCGCGGKAKVAPYHGDGYESFYVYCQKCNIETDYYEFEAEAITAWNRAMGERTAKVENQYYLPYLTTKGELKDMLYYGLLKEDWKKK